MLAETSRYIPGTSNKYSSTEDGRIYSHSRVDVAGRLRKGRWLKFHKNTNGYLCVSNPIAGDTKVHRMIAKSFIGLPEPGMQVNHKNGDKTDNRVENLEWCTPGDNTEHAHRTGLISRDHLKIEYRCDKCGRSIKTRGGYATHYYSCRK